MAEADLIKSQPATRRCCYCKRRKPFADFPPNKAKKWGVQAYCRECARIKSAAQARKRRENNPNHSAIARVQKYGLTIAEFEAMLKAQRKACAICGATARLNIDHCHASGQVRGLLCNHCNHALGFFRDNVDSIKRAAEYVERWNKVEG